MTFFSNWTGGFSVSKRNAFVQEFFFVKIKKRNEPSTSCKFNFLNTGCFTIVETNKAAASQRGRLITLPWHGSVKSLGNVSSAARLKWNEHLTCLTWKKDFFSRCSPRTTSTRATFLPLMQWRPPSLRRFKWSPRRNVQSTVASTERWTSGGRTPLDIFGLFETKWYPFTFLLLYHLWFLDLYPIISFQKLWNTLYKDGEGGQFMWVHCQSISPSPHPPKIKVMGNKGW